MGVAGRWRARPRSLLEDDLATVGRSTTAHRLLCHVEAAAAATAVVRRRRLFLGASDLGKGTLT